MDAVIYARISHADDDSTIGVDRQESDGRKLVEARGWRLAAVHVDNNRSAWRRNRRRPGWDALLEDIREHRVDVVVVAHPDRLMRQPRDLEDLLDISRETGVQLVSAGGNRDLSSPDDVFILRIEVAHACRSSDDTSRRIRRGHEAAAAAGRPGGGTGRMRPYGYTANQLDLIPAEQVIVQEAAVRVLAGESLQSVCNDLNARQVPTVSGVAWYRTTLGRILRSPRTAGLREHHSEVVGPASWPALLDRETWDRVNAVLDRPVPVGQNARRHLMSGLIRCEHCQIPLGARSGEPPGYACDQCHQRVARHLLDAFVDVTVVAWLADPTLLHALTEPTAPEDAADRAFVAECEARIEKVLAEWEETGASAAWARKRVDRIRAEQDEVNRRLVARARRVTLGNLPKDVDLDTWRALPLASRRVVVAELFPNLSIHRSTRRGPGLDTSRVTFD